jgi:hypothetical protein
MSPHPPGSLPTRSPTALHSSRDAPSSRSTSMRVIAPTPEPPRGGRAGRRVRADPAVPPLEALDRRDLRRAAARCRRAPSGRARIPARARGRDRRRAHHARRPVRRSPRPRRPRPALRHRLPRFQSSACPHDPGSASARKGGRRTALRRPAHAGCSRARPANGCQATRISATDIERRGPHGQQPRPRRTPAEGSPRPSPATEVVLARGAGAPADRLHGRRSTTVARAAVPAVDRWRCACGPHRRSRQVEQPPQRRSKGRTPPWTECYR